MEQFCDLHLDIFKGEGVFRLKMPAIVGVKCLAT